MQARIKATHNGGVTRFETTGDVKEVIINENVLDPDKESISLCFRGNNSSGIIDLTPAEVDKLYEAIKDRIHLIKGFKSLSLGGAKFI